MSRHFGCPTQGPKPNPTNSNSEMASSSYNSNYLRLLSCTKLLTSHVNNARHDQALALFCRMQSSPVLALDPFAFPLALKSCAAAHLPRLGAAIHAHSAKAALVSNPFVACALVDMYGKCSSIASARQVFDESPHRNVVVWNALISLYAHSGNVAAALELFETMNAMPNASTFNSIVAALSEVGQEPGEGASKALRFYRKMRGFGLKPNLITILALLKSCVGLAALNLIKEIHGYSIRNSIDSHIHLNSALVEAYGRCGCLTNAQFVFDCISEKDVVAWSSLISAHALHGEARKALEIFRLMESARVKPDDLTFLAVLKACSHAGLADEAKIHIARMPIDYGVEVGSHHYACLVDALSRAGRLYEAYEVITKMPVKVTAKAWGALLGACRTYGEVDLAKLAGQALFDLEPDNAANYLHLARIYGAAGRFEEVENIRRKMRERGVRAAPGSSWCVRQN